MDTYQPPKLPTPSTGPVWYVSTSGSDSADGSEAHPFASIANAVEVSAAARTLSPSTATATVLVRGGRYELSETVQLGAAHSGLTIQNFEGEHVELSGGVSFQVPKASWQPYKQRHGWEARENRVLREDRSCVVMLPCCK